MASSNCTVPRESAGDFHSLSLTRTMAAAMAALAYVFEHRASPGPEYPAVVDAFVLAMSRAFDLAAELESSRAP